MIQTPTQTARKKNVKLSPPMTRTCFFFSSRKTIIQHLCDIHVITLVVLGEKSTAGGRVALVIHVALDSPVQTEKKAPCMSVSVCARTSLSDVRSEWPYVASPRLLSGVAVVMQGPMPTFTRVLEQHENGEQAPRRRVAGLFIVS